MPRPRRRPDVIVIMADDQTAVSLPHSPPVMPYLQARLSDPADHWVRFSQAFANVALCCPARATTLAGQYSQRTGVDLNEKAPTFDDQRTVATWLDGAGYRTALVGKYFNAYPFDDGLQTPPGWDRWVATDFNPGDERYFDYSLIEDGTRRSYGAADADYLTDVLARKAVSFIRNAPKSAPLYLHFTPIAGHHPWTPAPRHVGAYSTMAPERPPNFNEADVSDKPAWVRALPLRSARLVDQVDASRRASYESLLSMDEAVKKIVDALRDRGTLDHSVIVYTSDHGRSFGEHRWSRKRCGYDECHQVPFAIRLPGAASRTVETFATHADIASTVTALAGITPTIPQDGVDLGPLVRGENVPSRDAILLHGVYDADFDTQPGYWGLRSPEWLYLELDTGERELYDLRGTIGAADPYRLQNRAGVAAYATIRAQLSDQVARLRDIAAPTVTVTVPRQDQAFTASSVQIVGDARDDVGVTRVTVAVKDRDTGQWWQGNGTWAAATKRLDATVGSPGAPQTDWTFAFDPGRPGRFTVQVQALDPAGRRSTIVARRFTT